MHIHFLIVVFFFEETACVCFKHILLRFLFTVFARNIYELILFTAKEKTLILHHYIKGTAKEPMYNNYKHSLRNFFDFLW